jgi:Xaa-Pro aminopeptidase
MLTAEGCRARRRRLWDSLTDACDLLLVSDPHHLAYLANYAPSPFTFRTVGANALLILEPERATLVGDNLVRPFLDLAHVDEIVAPVWYEGKRSARNRRDLLPATVLDHLGGKPPRRVGLEGNWLPTAISEGLRASRADVEWTEIGPTLLSLRRCKDDDEVAAIRRSIRAGEAGIAAARSELRPGLTEIEAYQIIEAAIQIDQGGRAFVYGDFVSGPESRRRLGPPTARVLKPGDLFLIDFSVVVDGYRGDIATTLVVGGEPTAEQLACFEGCRHALAVGETQLRPGVPCLEIDAAIRTALAETGQDPQSPGHLGHGIGLDHPEPPYIVAESAERLEIGDVVTLEPGQYDGSLGSLRWERNYRITPGGFELLSHHPLTLGT